MKFLDWLFDKPIQLKGPILPNSKAHVGWIKTLMNPRGFGWWFLTDKEKSLELIKARGDAVFMAARKKAAYDQRISKLKGEILKEALSEDGRTLTFRRWCPFTESVEHTRDEGIQATIAGQMRQAEEGFRLALIKAEEDNKLALIKSEQDNERALLKAATDEEAFNMGVARIMKG